MENEAPQMQAPGLLTHSSQILTPSLKILSPVSFNLSRGEMPIADFDRPAFWRRMSSSTSISKHHVSICCQVQFCFI